MSIWYYLRNMLSAQGIKKSYGDLQVLKGVDLQINKGEIVAIVGASGAGKSTLLHIIGTLDQADEGQLIINSTNISKSNKQTLTKFRNQEIGFIFQFHHLLPEFTALENVLMPALIGGASKTATEPYAIELLTKLGLKDRVQHKPNQLSGGEQQRVAVARALINKPSIVLADEPSGNLDSQSALALHELFFELRDSFQQTFIVVTHNPKLAQMSDRIIEMKNGLVV